MRFAVAVVLFVAGAVTALATTAVHQLWWGLVLGVAATVAALVALSPGWLTRLPFGLGWTGFVAWVAPSRPEGDYAISSNAQGYALLASALVALVFSLVTLPRPGRGASARSAAPPRMTG